jgi:hypothetical protein
MTRRPLSKRLDTHMTKALSASNRTRPRPLNPYIILLVAIFLPGFGYALCGEGRRGFTMQMFMIALAFTTWHLAPPSASFIGKLAGGALIYALSLPDTYRLARTRWIAARSSPVS